MLTNEILTDLDPSRSTVYQMLDAIKETVRLKTSVQATANLFLFKTEPDIDSLYNFVHILSNDFSAADQQSINDFFGQSNYRLKASVDEGLKEKLLERGYKLKNSSFSLVAVNLKELDCQPALTAEIKIKCADTDKALRDVKSVFIDAFDYSASDYDRKFGFLDEFKLNSQNISLKAYVLYENEQAVSTASYYAYDKFSIENVGTIKSARGKGYAALLLKTMLNEAKKLGYNEACLVSSEAALMVYKKIGFREIIKNNIYTK